MNNLDKLSVEQTGLIGASLFACIHAGREIMNVYRTEFDIELKADNSPLTMADRMSHDIVTSVLSAAWPEIEIISEEGEHKNYQERQNWQRCWLVDPLDGTKGFTHRNDEFAVCIALVEDGKPVLGMIYGPVDKNIYLGIPGSGVWSLDCSRCEELLSLEIERFDNDEAVKVFDLVKDHLKELKPVDSSLKDIPKPLRVIASRNHLNSETEQFIRSLEKKHSDISIVNIGSALKFALLAEGKADIYPRYAPTCEWDVAAGQAIVEAIGGLVIRAEDQLPLVYNKENLLNPWFIAARLPVLLD